MEFVSRLSRLLVYDRTGSDDIAQETWLAALKSPPQDNRPIRPWLKKVVLNFARKQHRDESRRKKNEEKLYTSKTVLSPVEIAEREEVRRNVIDAVLSLNKPYRSAIKLCYYQNLSHKEAAKCLNIPRETLRTHLKRGLIQLREKLDKEYGGDRRTWCLALAPLVDLTSTSTTVGATGFFSVTHVVKSISLAHMKLILATLFLLSAVFVLWKSSFESNHYSSDQEILTAKLVNTGEEISRSVEIDNPIFTRQYIHPAGSYIAGIVLDEVTGDPVEDFEISVHNIDTEEGITNTLFSKNIKNDHGRFFFPLGEEMTGSLRLWVRSDQYPWIGSTSFESESAKGLENLVLKIDTGWSASGKVVKQVTGQPVAGALVWAAQNSSRNNFVRRYKGLVDCEKYTFTDESGRFQLANLKGRRQHIGASTPDFVQAYVFAEKDEENVVLPLRDGYRIFGCALDDDGDPVSGLMVRMTGSSIYMIRHALTDEAGFYHLPPVLPGTYYIYAGPKPVTEGVIYNFTEETKTIEIVNKDVEVNFGSDPLHVTWRGTLIGRDSRAIKNAYLDICPEGIDLYTAWENAYRRYANCDKQGDFVFRKLSQGFYSILVHFEKSTSYTELPPMFFSSPGVTRRNLYVHGATICGAVFDKTTGIPVNHLNGEISVQMTDKEVLRSSSGLDCNGRFEINGLSTGNYNLSIKVPGYLEKTVEELIVEEGELINNLLFEILPGVEVKFVLSNFKNLASEYFIVNFIHSDASQSVYEYQVFDYTGCWQKSYFLTPGKWTARFSLDWLGLLEHSFYVHIGEAINIELSRLDIRSSRIPVTLKGSLSRPNGVPVPHAGITITGYCGSNSFHSSIDRFDRTDSKGQFAVHALIPGRWKVSLYLDGQGTTCLDDLVIPDTKNDTYSCFLVIPSGSIKAYVKDNVTHLPLNPDRSPSQILIKDMKNDCKAICSSLLSPEGWIWNNTLPPGTYQLYIDALGYWEYESETITIGEGKTIDLGTIQLEPCGTLELTLVDSIGRHITKACVFLDEKPLSPKTQLRSRPQWLFDKLPSGTLTCRITSIGYEDVTITFFSEPGHLEKTRVTLKNLNK